MAQLNHHWTNQDSGQRYDVAEGFKESLELNRLPLETARQHLTENCNKTVQEPNAK